MPSLPVRRPAVHLAGWRPHNLVAQGAAGMPCSSRSAQYDEFGRW